jgi:putative endonuclease
MPSARRRLGDFGEAAAVAHMQKQGYRLLVRNWRCPLGEIDLVAQQDDQVVFVEVRTRRGSNAVAPEESVTPTKQQRLIALAYAYLEAHELPDSTPWRIDVIAVIIGSNGHIARLTHLPTAVEE